MDELPVAIIKLEILPRVPTKSLVRFKSVCKDWLSFLSSQEFAKRHLLLQSRKQQKRLLVLHPPTGTFRTLDCEAPNFPSTTFRHIPFGGRVLYLASLDGLICVGIDKTICTSLILWNPLTGAYKTLSYNDDVYRHSFNNDNTNNDAIGFYVSNDDYKLLHISRNNRAYIYSLRFDRWRRIKFLENDVAQRISNYKWSPVIFSNKSLYFTAGCNYNGGEQMVICFDVNSQKFREIQFPADVHNDANKRRWRLLVDVNDCLHLYYGYEYNRDILFGHYVNSEIGLWRMEANQWKKVACFVDVDTGAKWFDWDPIYITKNNENSLMIGDKGTTIYKIDFKTKDDCVPLYNGFHHTIQQALYIESFVSPNP